MNPSSGPDVDVKTLLALRRENDAVRLITERLKVKEMGPADHIRTKHEVKSFVTSGDPAMAESLLIRARERRGLSESIAIKISQRRDQRMAD